MKHLAIAGGMDLIQAQKLSEKQLVDIIVVGSKITKDAEPEKMLLKFAEVIKMIKEVMEEINQVINQVMTLVDAEQLASLLPLYTKDKKIFVSGAGRSGFQAKGFAMRLMHLGYQSYVMGETITPPLHSGDLFVAISGSRTTKKC